MSCLLILELVTQRTSRTHTFMCDIRLEQTVVTTTHIKAHLYVSSIHDINNKKICQFHILPVQVVLTNVNMVGKVCIKAHCGPSP